MKCKTVAVMKLVSSIVDGLCVNPPKAGEKTNPVFHI